MVTLDDEPPLDGPEQFTEAAEVFLWRYQFTEAAEAFLWRYPDGYRLTIEQVAAALAWLAWRGDIVSAAHHDRICQSYAAQLQQVSAAADELVRRLNGENE